MTTIQRQYMQKLSQKYAGPKCAHCVNLGLKADHWLRESSDPRSKVVCSVLLKTECPYCNKKGHTESYCAVKKRDASTAVKKSTSSQPTVRQSQSDVKQNMFAAFESDDEEVKPPVSRKRKAEEPACQEVFEIHQLNAAPAAAAAAATTAASSKFYISCFTKLKHPKIDETIQEQAEAEGDSNTINYEITTKPKKFIDVKAIMRNNPFFYDLEAQDTKNGRNKANKKVANKVIAHINYNSEKYTNILFLKDRPSWLILDNTGIMGLYVKTTGTKNVSFFSEEKNQVPDAELDIIFTRVMEVSNDTSALESKLEADYRIAAIESLGENLKFIIEPSHLQTVIEKDNQTNFNLLQTVFPYYMDFSLQYIDNVTLDTLDTLKNLIYTNDEHKIIWEHPLVVFDTTREMLKLLEEVIKVKETTMQTFLKDQVKITFLNSFYKDNRLKYKKIFFFKTTIKPFDAQYKKYRMGNSFFIQRLTNIWNAIFTGITELVTKEKQEEKRKHLLTYLSSEKVSLLDYLLPRVQEIGILDNKGDDIRIFDESMDNSELVATEEKLKALIITSLQSITEITGEQQKSFFKWLGQWASAIFCLRSRKGGNRNNYTESTLTKKLASKYTRRDKRNTPLNKTRRNRNIIEKQNGGEYGNIHWFKVSISAETNFLSRIQGKIYDAPARVLNVFKGFDSEKDIKVDLIVFKEIFNKDTFYAPTLLTPGNFIESFASNFDNAFTQTETYYYFRFANKIKLDPTPTSTNTINIKTIVCDLPDYSNIRKLNFYMDAGFLSAAAAEYPSTWDDATGKALEAYDSNRTKFFADLKSGAIDLSKKKRAT